MDYDEEPDYLDLDDILTQTQKVSCTFLFSIPGLQFLDKVHEADQGTTITLPFWMARTLYTHSMIDIELPESYQFNFRQILVADPDLVNLRLAGPHYYKFGKLLMGLKREKGNNLAPFLEDGQRNKFRREEGETFDEKRSVANSLMYSFHTRRHQIIERSTNQATYNRADFDESVREFISQMDFMERRLFEIGRQHAIEKKRWETREIEMLSRNFKERRLAKKRKVEEHSNKSKDNA